MGVTALDREMNHATGSASIRQRAVVRALIQSVRHSRMCTLFSPKTRNCPSVHPSPIPPDRSVVRKAMANTNKVGASTNNASQPKLGSVVPIS